MARYGIVSPKAFGVRASAIRQLAKRLGRDHALANPLWKTGWYEARVLVSFVGEPDRLTSPQMDRWAADFDNWAVCDALCFHLFDRSPFAWQKVRAWCDRPEEFVRRAGFALLASIALHDKSAPDRPFLSVLPLIEHGAKDDRNFVKKGVSWALRSIGRRNPTLNAAAITSARHLIASREPAARWVGRDALRELTGPVVRRRLAARPSSGNRAARRGAG
jgi:3-methyladenine DNA glycosylase AlkD